MHVDAFTVAHLDLAVGRKRRGKRRRGHEHGVGGGELFVEPSAHEPGLLACRLQPLRRLLRAVVEERPDGRVDLLGRVEERAVVPEHLGRRDIHPHERRVAERVRRVGGGHAEVTERLCRVHDGAVDVVGASIGVDHPDACGWGRGPRVAREDMPRERESDQRPIVIP